MNWIEMTPAGLRRAARTCKGVCVVPTGCLECHGDHMPLGTDCFQVDAMVERAARIEPVVKFPIYFQTQISEARHIPGTFSLPSRLLWDLLESTLDEIARNGFRKIVIVNGHGGNYAFLRYFADRLPAEPKDYVLYLFNFARWPCDGLPEMKKILDTPPNHGGEVETSLMMAIRPDLVKKSAIPKTVRAGLKRLDVEGDFYTGFNWFAGNPDQYQGHAEAGTAKKGEILLEAAAKRLARAFRAAKADSSAQKVQDEFFRLVVGKAQGRRKTRR
ncbi:MAG: creatininase family protein [Planctomycetota bacterium]